MHSSFFERGTTTCSLNKQLTMCTHMITPEDKERDTYPRAFHNRTLSKKKKIYNLTPGDPCASSNRYASLDSVVVVVMPEMDESNHHSGYERTLLQTMLLGESIEWCAARDRTEAMWLVDRGSSSSPSDPSTAAFIQ